MPRTSGVASAAPLNLALHTYALHQGLIIERTEGLLREELKVLHEDELEEVLKHSQSSTMSRPEWSLKNC